MLRRRLARDGRARLRLRGHSMHPLLRDGARVELRPAPVAARLAGRIVAVDTGDSVVVHRVLRARGDWIETQGITRTSPDPPHPVAAVIGVVAGPRWLATAAAACAAAYRLRHRIARRHS